MNKRLRTSDEIAAVYDAEAQIDALFDRLKSVKSRLAELLWDLESEDLQHCLIELNAVIREQVDLQRVVRCEQRSASRCVETEALSKTVN